MFPATKNDIKVVLDQEKVGNPCSIHLWTDFFNFQEHTFPLVLPRSDERNNNKIVTIINTSVFFKKRRLKK